MGHKNTRRIRRAIYGILEHTVNIMTDDQKADAAIERHNAVMAVLENDFPAVAYERIQHARNLLDGLCMAYTDNIDSGHCEGLRQIINSATYLLGKAAENEAKK